MEINEPFLTKQSRVKNTDLLSIRLLYLKDGGFDRLLLYPMYFFCQTLCKLLVESHENRDPAFQYSLTDLLKGMSS